MADLIVAGSAACVFDDFKRAAHLSPTASVMLVNGACQLFWFADHILAGHTNKANQYVAARNRRFPDAPPYRVHANWREHGEHPRARFPVVTDWWGPEMSSGATSAGKAALIGLAMGFDRVILAGCPMDGSGYAPGETDGIIAEPSCARIGDPKKQRATTVRRYKETMAQLAETTFKGRVFSLSGLTKQLLGEPT